MGQHFGARVQDAQWPAGIAGIFGLQPRPQPGHDLNTRPVLCRSKQLRTPASADNADSVMAMKTMQHGRQRGLQMWRVLDHAEQVLGIEAMCAAQASDLRGSDHAMAPALRQLHDAFRSRVPFLERDAVMAPLMAASATWLRESSPLDLVDLHDPQS